MALEKYTKNLSPSRALACRMVYVAFQILQERGGQALGREVMDEIANRLTFNDWEKTVYGIKNGSGCNT